MSFLLFSNLIIGINFFSISTINGTSLKDCQIKIHDRDWAIIDDCDSNNIDEWWSGGVYDESDLSIDYNLGDRINIWIKVFNKLPYHSSSMNINNYEDFCSIYIHFYMNEYYINNEKDYIYYCKDCNCTSVR